MDANWIMMDAPTRPPDNALIIYYVPFARYVWGSGLDYIQIKAEYPGCTHWAISTNEPQDIA